MRSTQEVRDLADQAQAENESGVVTDAEDQAWLDGVEHGLRWAAGDGTTTRLQALLDRQAEASS